MQSASFALALVLQCAPLLQLAPSHPVFTNYSLSKLDVSGIHGDVSPCPVLPAGSAALATERTEHALRAFTQDLAVSNASPLYLAEADLDQILPPGTAHPVPAGPGLGTAPPAPPSQPTYESWDVLRQYPRATPLAPPAAPAPKTAVTPKTSKESKDAQSTTTPDEN